MEAIKGWAAECRVCHQREWIVDGHVYLIPSTREPEGRPNFGWKCERCPNRCTYKRNENGRIIVDDQPMQPLGYATETAHEQLALTQAAFKLGGVSAVLALWSKSPSTE